MTDSEKIMEAVQLIRRSLDDFGSRSVSRWQMENVALQLVGVANRIYQTDVHRVVEGDGIRTVLSNIEQETRTGTWSANSGSAEVRQRVLAGYLCLLNWFNQNQRAALSHIATVGFADDAEMNWAWEQERNMERVELKTEEATEYLGKLADALDEAERIKADCPGEGALYIDISDELAREISQNLRTVQKLVVDFLTHMATR